ncbi:recombinase family protein [Parafrankia sp. FMc6]|uniref:recombinase family protein n=1 Tax=Parafrankia soli TaxID=2599596 RepID=UPI0034D4F9E5
MDADGYTRLSKNRDGRKENCARQAKDIRAAAKTAGDSIVRIGTDDSLSAWKRNVKRPGWEETVRRVEAGAIRKIWLWRIDRMMRQPYDLEELIAKGERHGLIIAATNGPPRDLSNYSDRHYLRGEVAAACRYSDEISDKSSRAHRDIAEAGFVHAGGRRPFGYVKVSNRRVPDPEEPGQMMPAPPLLEVESTEADVVREIYRRFLAGDSLHAISMDLHAAGVPTVTGAPWSNRVVKHILTSGPVAGLRMHKGVPVAEGGWPAIISRAQWDEVGRLLAAGSRPAHNARVEYLLTGLIVCGREGCGKPLRTLSGGAGGKNPPNYVCSAKERFFGCGRLGVRVARVDEFVGDALARVLDDPDAVRPGEAHDAMVAEAQVTAESARRLLAEIAEDYGAERITKAERDASRAGPAKRLASAEEILRTRRPHPELITQGKRWADMEFPQRRATARAYIRRVVVSPAATPGGRWDEGRVFIDWR